MKKRLKFSWASLIIFVIAVLLWLLNKFVQKIDTRKHAIYIFGVGGEEISKFLHCAVIIAVALAIIVFLFKNIRKIVIPIIISCVLALLIFLYIYGIVTNPFLNLNRNYYELVSDDKQHTIIICESSWLFTCSGTVYEKTSPYMMTNLDGYYTEGNTPVESNQYSINWNENGFEFRYNKDGNYETLDIKYIE